MPSFRTGTVTRILSERAGLQRVDVDGRPAYVLTQLIGDVTVGDRVVVNTTAVELGLGTGGWDVVHWNLAREAWDGASGGHVLKLRYTSLQVDTGVAEEDDGYREVADLGGMPVVVCGVHSQVAAVAVAFRHQHAGRLVYVMTDAAALPLALSDLVADLVGSGLLQATVTAGHAFGGDHEAVNTPSALAVAKAVAGADAVVVGPGPGGAGTASRRGFGALEGAGIVDSARRDGGVPILVLRWSDADERHRHQGVSHHSRTVLAALEDSVTVPYPSDEEPPDVGGHDAVAVDVPDMARLLADAGVAVTTMGRGVEADPGFFRYAGAAGVAAGRLLTTGAIR